MGKTHQSRHDAFIMSDQYPAESLTEEEARRRYRDCEFVHISSIFGADGERRPAIFVWRKDEDSDKEDPVAVYWLT
jgi:hypothetical protein